jgi:hypothetical protein
MTRATLTVSFADGRKVELDLGFGEISDIVIGSDADVIDPADRDRRLRETLLELARNDGLFRGWVAGSQDEADQFRRDSEALRHTAALLNERARLFP